MPTKISIISCFNKQWVLKRQVYSYKTEVKNVRLWRKSTEDRDLALHTADPGSLAPHVVSRMPLGVILEYRLGINPKHC